MSLAGVKRADIVIFTKCGKLTDEQKEGFCRYIKEIKDVPVFFSKVRYGTLYPLFESAKTNVQITKESRVLLVTGIAKPQPLKAEIEKRGATVELMQYGDHHNFSAAELNDIANFFSKSGSTVIVTTEKDATRIKHRKELPQIVRNNIYALPIEVEFLNEEEKLFNKNIYDYVTKNSRNS